MHLETSTIAATHPPRGSRQARRRWLLGGALVSLAAGGGWLLTRRAGEPDTSSVTSWVDGSPASRQNATSLAGGASSSRPMSPAAPAPVQAARLEPGVLDGYALIRQDGAPFDAARLRGKTVLMNFAFTSCSTTCPLTTQQLRSLQASLAEVPDQHIEFITVSVDPSVDSPQALAHYAQAQRVDLANWQWLTGEASVLARFIDAFGGARKGANQPGDHLTSLFMIDGHGRLIGRFQGVDIDRPRVFRELLDLDRTIGATARRHG